MAQHLNRLTAKAVTMAKGPALLSDGGGLYLAVAASGARSWVYIYKRKVLGSAKPKRTELGLGSLTAVSLAMARERAAECRTLLAAGRNPKDAREPTDRVPTFGEMADQFVAAMEGSWKNQKHREQWKMTLTVYAAVLRDKPVNQIGVDDVLAVLKPHWERRPETADRLRGRIERVLNAAWQGRRSGAGRKAVATTDPELVPELKRLVEPATPGDPMRPLIWVSKSMDELAAALTDLGHPVSGDTVARELVKLGFSRQHNRKADEGSKHPDRNAQFEHINTKVVAAQAAGHPVISVDTKKKELVGNYKNGGTDYRPKGMPERVNVHDFIDKEKGKAVPYGVYDVTANTGVVSVGITADTAEFAVAAIRTSRERMGCSRYPNCDELAITADCGGSNGARVRLWKLELQKLADETDLTIYVHHYPPGTSKWNRIEHRLFCHITQNWRGRPLTDRVAIVELIGAATTKAGLTVECALDERTYEKGIKVSDAQMAMLNIAGDDFHPAWNYTITPRRLTDT